MIVAKKGLNYPKKDNRKYTILFVNCSANDKSSSLLSDMVKRCFESEIETGVIEDVLSQKELWQYRKKTYLREGCKIF